MRINVMNLACPSHVHILKKTRHVSFLLNYIFIPLNIYVYVQSIPLSPHRVPIKNKKCYVYFTFLYKHIRNSHDNFYSNISEIIVLFIYINIKLNYINNDKKIYIFFFSRPTKQRVSIVNQLFC